MSFAEKVWKAMSRIPKGRVSTYQSIARAVGSPQSARAVGNACNQNPYAPRIPCHRVVKSNGALGGFADGPQKKIMRLKREGIQIKKGRVVDFSKRFFDVPRIER